MGAHKNLKLTCCVSSQSNALLSPTKLFFGKIPLNVILHFLNGSICWKVKPPTVIDSSYIFSVSVAVNWCCKTSFFNFNTKCVLHCVPIEQNSIESAVPSEPNPKN